MAPTRSNGRMHTPIRLALTLCAALASVSCGDFGTGACLHADCRVIDSFAASIYLCGFPRDQLATTELGTSFIRQGQRIELRLVGDMKRVRTIRWEVTQRIEGSTPPQVRLTPTSGTTAILEGIAPGGGSPIDDVFVGAPLTFQDGSQGGAPLAYCRGSDRIPANRLVVTTGP